MDRSWSTYIGITGAAVPIPRPATTRPAMSNPSEPREPVINAAPTMKMTRKPHKDLLRPNLSAKRYDARAPKKRPA